MPLDRSLLQDGRSIAHSGGCLDIFLIFCFYHLKCLCNEFMDVGHWSLKEGYLKVCDNTAMVASGKVGIP